MDEITPRSREAKVKREELVETFFEIEPLSTEMFLKVKETLTRIGLPTKPDPRSDDNRPTLWQSCHVLHKKGRYFICHFKQLFMLDGKYETTDFTDDDEDRVEHVVALLEEWGLVKCMFDVEKIDNIPLKVLSHTQKKEWRLATKYALGESRMQSIRDAGKRNKTMKE